MMINCPDVGYTPNNFKTLVKATKLSKIAFVKRFNLSKAMFYRYQNGEVTMQHSDWVALKDTVEGYIAGNGD